MLFDLAYETAIATIYAEPDDNVIFLDELEEHEHSADCENHPDNKKENESENIEDIV